MTEAALPSQDGAATFPGLPPGLTASQREAVMADEPVLCVLAGAGAGKTGVLTLRVARRVSDESAAAERTLVCTFSRKAADELRTRLYRLDVVGVQAGTIHRVALQILRDWSAHTSAAPPIVLGDRRRVIEEVSGGERSATSVHVDAEIGWAKARMLSPVDYELAAQAARRVLRLPVGHIAQLYAAYERERARRGLVDLDDLLLSGAGVLEEHAAFAGAIRWRFRHLLVDEMQDVNPAQFRLLRALVGTEPDLFVVGDPDQAVYGWNGADPELLGGLAELYPQTRVIRLDDNHRCTPAVVRTAAAALGATGSAPKSSRPEGAIPTLAEHETDGDEALWVARQTWLAHRPGRRWSHLAVLARTNAQLKTVAEAMHAQRIPVVFAGGDLGPASDLEQPSDGSVIQNDADADALASHEQTDGVVLSTIHRAKGLQWPCVFVVGLSEGLLPLFSARTEAAVAEERRLLYVALTRAQDELWCSWARHGVGDGRAPRKACRWLPAMEVVIATVEREHAPAPPDAVASHVAHLRSLVTKRAPLPTG